MSISFLNLLSISATWTVKCILAYSLIIPPVALLAARQEYKIWKTTSTPLSLWAILKIITFNTMWMLSALICALSLFPIWVIRGFGRSVETEAHSVLERLIGTSLVKYLVGNVVITGREHLLEYNENRGQGSDEMNANSPKAAPIYVANHCSQIDAAVVYYPFSKFKWIAKQSVMFLPGPGNLMYFSGHVFIKRAGKNKNSVSNLYELSSQAVQNGTPMMIFPQGSRRRSQKLPFKNGAYRIAMQNKSDIIPVSIHVPDGCWNSSYPFNLIFSFLLRSTHVDVPLITMTIHKPIKFSEDTSLDQLREKSMEQIYSVLPPVCDSTTQISTSNKEKVK